MESMVDKIHLPNKLLFGSHVLGLGDIVSHHFAIAFLFTISFISFN